MRKRSISHLGFFQPRALAGFLLCSIGLTLGFFALSARPITEVVGQSGKSAPVTIQPGRLPPEFSISSSGSGICPLSDPLGQSNRWRLAQTVDSNKGAALSDASSAAPDGNIWSIASSPNGGFAPTALSAVTCVNASDCWAVGRTEIGQTFANTALFHWDGASWNVVPSPSVEKETNGLADIICNSTSDCWAVGYRIILQTVQVQTLILHWDGVSWQIVPSPNVGAGFNALYGVACSSASNCWAVGFSNQSTAAETLIEKWDGQSWTVQSSPNVGTASNVLNAVTCLSDSDCRAVGYSGMTGAKSCLVAKWDGTQWTASTLPNQPLAQENTLTSVECNSAADCWAVGNSYNGAVHQTLIEQWNGTSWSSALAPNTGADNYLTRVTCASMSDCWAVGNSTNAAVDPQAFDQDLLLHWNGTAWLPNTDLTNLTSTYASDLAGVTCTASSQCWAVGFFQPSGSGRPQIAGWNGSSWALVSAPDVPAQPSNFLDDVTCASQSDCWAVGFNFYGNIARSMTMHWDGVSWGIHTSPNTAVDRNNYLGHATCLSTSDCWAVGNSSDTIGTQRQALSMHWDGAAWSIVDVSPVDTSQSAETTFEGIACNSTSDCWAVGFSLIQDYAALIEHWNGTSWTLVSAPPLSDPTSRSIFYDIACTGASDCTAVGVQWTTALTGSGLYQTLVAHYDGTSWSLVASPNTSSDEDNILSAVTCVSPTNCWAVGSSNNYSQALVEHWDGSSWTMTSVPQSGTILNAVACSSATDCWAAGPYYSPDPPAQTLLMHWDGNAWAAITSPNTSPADSNYLAGIACPSSSGCWAVGQYWRKSSPQTLTLRYTPIRSLLNITSIRQLDNRDMLVQGTGVPNAVNRIEASPDLSPNSFQTAGSVTADSSGVLSFEDTNPGTQRFYRIAFP